MNILAIDTATEACSVALLVGDAITHKYQVAPQQQAQLVLPMVDEILSDAGLSPRSLDGLAFGRGPGSFTGVRIATATVQGIALGLDCGVIGVSTLAAVAHRAWREQDVTHCIATIDARMQQLYWGCYVTTEQASTRLLGEEQVTDSSAVVLPDKTSADSWFCVGTGATQYQSQLEEGAESFRIICEQELSNACLPTAYDLLHLARAGFLRGEAVPADQVVPVYLRDKVALTEAERSAQS